MGACEQLIRAVVPASLCGVVLNIFSSMISVQIVFELRVFQERLFCRLIYTEINFILWNSTSSYKTFLAFEMPQEYCIIQN